MEKSYVFLTTFPHCESLTFTVLKDKKFVLTNFRDTNFIVTSYKQGVGQTFQCFGVSHSDAHEAATEL